MKRYKRIIIILVCSFVLGSMIQIEGFQKDSINGCGTTIYTNMNDFYAEKKNSIQMLALGDSNIYRGFSPVIYWKDTNITSYSLASASQPAWLSYYLLEDALAYQSPKVVLFEINELFAKSTGQIPRYCSAINTFHTASARLKAIQDDTGGLNEEDKDILYGAYASDVYHHTMDKLLSTKNKKTSKLKENHLKGYLYETTVIPFPGYESYMSRYDMTLKIDEKKAYYIDKIIALCKKKHITLVFAKFPTIDWTTQKSELAKQFASERNISLLDMNVDVLPIDWMSDTKDAGFHMNDSGAIKCTRAVEQFLEENTKLEPTKDKNVIQSYDIVLNQYLNKVNK